MRRPVNSPFQPFFKPSVNKPVDSAMLQRGEEIREDQWGGNALIASRRGWQGTIADRDLQTHSYTVSYDYGDGILKKQGVGRILQDPNDTRMLPVGTRVALSDDFGDTFIIGVIPYTSGREGNETRISITGENGVGSEDPLEQTKPSTANYKPQNAPADLGPNDWVQTNEEGNLMGVLAGGVNIMKSSGMSQVRTHMLNDLVEIISRNYRHVSDMGESKIKNEGGRITWSFRGGSDQLTEAGSDQENWTIRIDLGAEGDLFRFELTQPDGGSNFKFHVDAEGFLSVYANSGIEEFSGTSKYTTVMANRTTDIKLDDTQTIRGNQSKHIYGNRNTVISSSVTDTVGNDKTSSIQRHLTETIGGIHEEKVVGGNPVTQTPGDLSRLTTLNAGWEINIGDPVSGANPLTLPGFALNTWTGDITRNINVKGNIEDNVTLGDITYQTLAGIATLKTKLGIANIDGTTVHLGPVAASATNPVVKGTLYASALGAFTSTNLSALSTALAATSSILGIVAPPTGIFSWNASVLMSTTFSAWMSALISCFSTLIAANAALASAVPGTLSTKAFVA